MALFTKTPPTRKIKTTRLIIAGSRHLTMRDYPLLERAVAKAVTKFGWDITEVVNGTALGGDALGVKYAKAHGIHVEDFEPDWGDSEDPNLEAGFLRNEDMACYAAQSRGGLIALWDGHSAGTRDMIARAKHHNLEVYVAYTGGRIAAR